MIQPATVRTSEPEWKRWVAEIAEDIRERKIYQPALPKLPEILAKVNTGETSGGKGLCLMGTCGTGKTYLLKAMSEMFGIEFIKAKALEDAGDSIYDILRVNRPRWSNIPRHWNSVILDDVGTEEPTVMRYGTVIHPFETALEIRYESFQDCGFVTHISTNLPEREFRRRYGERVWSRLNEMCAFISMTGPDRRMRVKRIANCEEGEKNED